MSLPHYLRSMEPPPTLYYHDEFKIDAAILRHPSPSSDASSSNFSFCAAPLLPPPLPAAYADEIFQNWKIQSQPSHALTLFEHLPPVETIRVHEILDPHAPSLSQTHHHHRHSHLTSPPHTHSSSDAASYTRAHPPRHSPASPTHTYSNFDPARAAHHQPPTSPESARATLLHRPAVAAKRSRAFSLFPLRKVFHVNEDEIPPRRDLFTPTKFKDKKSSAASQNGSSFEVSQGKKGIYRNLQWDEAPLPPPSPHVIHYNAQRAHKETLKRRTSLPYRHGFLACIGY